MQQCILLAPAAGSKPRALRCSLDPQPPALSCPRCVPLLPAPGPLQQRARQDAALKLLQKLGYTVNFSGTYTGGLDPDTGLPLGLPPGQAAAAAAAPAAPHAHGQFGGGGGGRGPPGGRGAPGGGGRGGGRGDGMKRFKPGPHGGKSLDARAAAAGPRAPPPDEYMAGLSEELS